MEILHDFLGSDAWSVAQLVVTLGLLVFVIGFSAQMKFRQKMLVRDNGELKNEISRLREHHEQDVKRLLNEQDRHRNLLAKIGDDVFDVRPLVQEDFGSDRQRGGSRPVKPGLDFSYTDESRTQRSSNDPRFGQKNPIAEPVYTSPAVSDVSDQYLDLEGPIDDSIDDDSDPLTRALKISKAIRR